MGLPKGLGPYGVSFVEFELRRNSEPGAAEHSQAENGAHQNGGKLLPSAEGAPMMRIFYPTASKKTFSVLDVRNRSWLPNVDYLMGFLSRVVSPSSFPRRALVWALTCNARSNLDLCPDTRCCFFLSCSSSWVFPSAIQYSVVDAIFFFSYAIKQPTKCLFQKKNLQIESL